MHPAPPAFVVWESGDIYAHVPHGVIMPGKTRFVSMTCGPRLSEVRTLSGTAEPAPKVKDRATVPGIILVILLL